MVSLYPLWQVDNRTRRSGGYGKTTFILNIAAKLSMGEGLDGGMNFTEPLNVIYQSAEDGLADTVKPRLEQAKADCEKISVIDER